MTARSQFRVGDSIVHARDGRTWRLVSYDARKKVFAAEDPYTGDAITLGDNEHLHEIFDLVATADEAQRWKDEEGVPT